MLAVEVPLLKVVTLGGLALGMAAMVHPHHHHDATKHRLSLHAPARADAFYLTVFAKGDITVSRDDAAPAPLTFTTRAFINDGCEWLSVEKLVPVDSRHYTYSYDETLLQCAPDATPCIQTPRTGVVTVDE
jgi:hypothetical protein